jgi:predicted membrane metal-binding protein
MIKKPKFGQLVYFSFQDNIVAGHITGFYSLDNPKYRVQVGNHSKHFLPQEKLFAKKDRCRDSIFNKLLDKEEKLKFDARIVGAKLERLFFDKIHSHI